MDTDNRFDRIEQKIDKLTDAVTKIVRVEEQLIANNRRVDNLESRVDKNTDDIDKVFVIARSNNTVARFADRFFWMVAAAGGSAIVYLLTHGV